MEKVISSLAGFLLFCWMLMLLVGGAHAEVSSSIPAVSFGGTVILVMLLGFVGSCLRGEASGRSGS